jgi:hypothetical protein
MSGTIHDTTGMGMGSGPTAETNPADAEAAIEAIERPNQWDGETVETTDPTTGEKVSFERSEPVTDQWLPKMDLPGFGEMGEDCGEEQTQFCECCADTWSVGACCRRSTCPRCAQTWVRESATQVSAKLKSAWAAMWKQSDEHPYFQHLVFDIPDDWCLAGDPETVYWRTIDVVKEILDAFGLAAVPIYHPYRGDAETPDDRGEWAERLFSGHDWDEVADELEFDPHFHIVGIAPEVDVSVTEKIHSETGWIIHRITQEDSGISIGSDYDMAAVVAYCLSHAGIREDTNGDMSAAAHTRIVERPWRKDGWMNGNIPEIYDRTREQFDRIVRSVAPRVLGIEFSSVACVREVPADEAANTDLSLAQCYDDFEHGDGDGDGSDDDRGDDPDEEGEVQLVKCEGRALHISQAHQYLTDDEWRESADYVRLLEDEYERWKKERGIAG